MPETARTGPNAEEINREVTQILARMLGKEISPEQPVMEAGLDSLGSVELRSSLQTRFAVELPATLTFDYPTTASLSKFLSSQLHAMPERKVRS